MKLPKREYDPVAEGIYIAELTGIDNNKPLSDRFPNDRKADEPQYNVEYTFEIIEDESGDTTFAKRKMWQTNHPYSSRNLAIYNAAHGTKLVNDDGVEFDEMSSVGKQVRLVIKHKSSDGKVKDFIESILAMPKGYAQPQPNADEPAAPAEGDEINIEDIPF